MTLRRERCLPLTLLAGLGQRRRPRGSDSECKGCSSHTYMEAQHRQDLGCRFPTKYSRSVMALGIRGATLPCS